MTADSGLMSRLDSFPKQSRVPLSTLVSTPRRSSIDRSDAMASQRASDLGATPRPNSRDQNRPNCVLASNVSRGRLSMRMAAASWTARLARTRRTRSLMTLRISIRTSLTRPRGRPGTIGRQHMVSVVWMLDDPAWPPFSVRAGHDPVRYRPADVMASSRRRQTSGSPWPNTIVTTPSGRTTRAASLSAFAISRS